MQRRDVVGTWISPVSSAPSTERQVTSVRGARQPGGPRLLWHCSVIKCKRSRACGMEESFNLLSRGTLLVDVVLYAADVRAVSNDGVCWCIKGCDSCYHTNVSIFTAPIRSLQAKHPTDRSLLTRYTSTRPSGPIREHVQHSPPQQCISESSLSL